MLRIFLFFVLNYIIKQKPKMSRFGRKNKPKANFQLSVVSDNEIQVKTSKVKNDDLRVIKKAINSNAKLKTFNVVNTDVHTLISLINNNDKYTLAEIPSYVQRIRKKNHPKVFDHLKIAPKLWNTLFPYQKEGVEQIINNYGSRCLLGDDMGLGKTFQALGFISYHINTNADSIRVLVVCPSYLRYHWQHSVKEWLDLDSQIAKKGKDVLTEKICIVSYSMLKALAIKPCVFNVVVCDESHYAKSRKALRTKALTPLVKSAQAALLITGTPALNRPIELFSQLLMLRPAYIKNYTTFAARYCNGKQTAFGYDDRGSSNEKELAWLLRKGFMVRRLKRDVLSQLPAKIRNSIWLEIKKSELGSIEKEFKKWKKLNERIYKMPSGSEEQREMIFERKTVISGLYLLTAEAKIKAVVDWVVDALQKERSFIFFAYHMNVLNAVEEAVKNLNLGYIRIDGSTPSHKRTSAVECFQTDTNIRIAILSIGAAGAGITLTRVNECVFGELVFVPGILTQAEDRIHRIGQEKKCEINYLLGTDTLDNYIFPNICKKLLLLDTVTDSRSDRTLEGHKSFVEAKCEESDLMSMLNSIF